MVSRESAVAALFARLNVSVNGKPFFITMTRRNRAPKSFVPAQTPALVLVEHSEEYQAPSMSVPKRSIFLFAILYFDCGNDENVIPSQTINAGLDAIDAALAPTFAEGGRSTLGGLVTACFVEGKIIRAPGEVTGKSLAIVPIRMLLP